jgi:hypothetical protein
VHAQICCSARENGRHSEKKPHGRCRGEGCAQEQRQIAALGRLGLYGLGGTIELIDLVRVDQTLPFSPPFVPAVDTAMEKTTRS